MLKTLTFVSLFLLNGCLTSQRGGLSQDVGQLLSQSGIQFEQLDCKMLEQGRTRNGVCVLSLSEETIKSFKQSLNLQLIPTYQLNFWQQQEGCHSLKPFQGLSDVYGVTGRPANLRINQSTNFEYLLLYYQPQSSQVCLQVSYAYS